MKLTSNAKQGTCTCNNQGTRESFGTKKCQMGAGSNNYNESDCVPHSLKNQFSPELY